jgi:hypothetical protein
MFPRKMPARYADIPGAALRGAARFFTLGANEPVDREVRARGNAMLEIFQAMQRRLDERPHLLRLGRLFSETVLVEVDGAEVYLGFEKGRLASVAPGPSRKTPWRFALRTDRAALEAFWQAKPTPGFHDIFGLVKIGRGRIDGDILALVKNLRFFKEFMALARHGAAT